MTRGRTSRRAAVAAAVMVVGVTAYASPVTAASTAASGVSVDEVYSAPVPSLCGYPAGRLVDGALPGTYPGVVHLAGRKKIVIGVLQAGRPAGAAAVVSCNRGGAPWPDNVVLYTPRLRVLGVVRLLGVNRHSAQTWVRRLWVDGKRNVHVQVLGVAENGDCDACAETGELLVFHHAAGKRRLVFTTKRIYTERPTARGLVAALNHHDRRAARRYATKKAVRHLFPVPSGSQYSLRGCYGLLSPGLPSSITPPDGIKRVCLVDVATSSGSDTVPLYMKKTGWNRWKATVARR